MIRVLSVRQAAEQLGVAETTVYGLCRQNLLRHFRVGMGRGTIRVREEDLDKFIEDAVVQSEEPTATQGRRSRHQR